MVGVEAVAVLPGRDVLRIEIVGVAGTGKSTLAQGLVARHPDWRIADSIHARELRHVPYFIHGVPNVVRLLAHGIGRGPLPDWDELKTFVYASEWQRYLARTEHGSSTTLFDQGPLFALARLLWAGSGVTSSPWFRDWIRTSARHWARELDVVVELTAPQDVLFARINDRAKRHPAKGSSALETADILASHGRAYDQVLGEVAQSGSVRLLRFDTSQRPLNEVVAAVTAELASASAGLDGTGSDEQPKTSGTRSTARNEIERLGSIG